jgi:hypothetical protein
MAILVKTSGHSKHILLLVHKKKMADGCKKPIDMSDQGKFRQKMSLYLTS